MPSMVSTSARLGLSTNTTASTGTPASEIALRVNSTNALLEWMLSFPPRSRQALPAFRHRVEMSMVMLGRLHKCWL